MSEINAFEIQEQIPEITKKIDAQVMRLSLQILSKRFL